MRPQLGSEPAIAVFTSGELAMPRAIRAAPSFVEPPPSPDGDQLPRAFAIARNCLRQRFHHGRDRRLHLRHLLRHRAARPRRRWPAAPACRWSKCRRPPTSGCSCAPRRASASRATARAGNIASVRTKPSVVAISGWIMPEPFVMPAMRTVPRRSLTSANAVFGTRSVVMMARAASSKPFAAQPLHQPRQRVDDFAADRVPRRSRPWRPAAPASPAASAACAAACDVASATASPVRVAQLALPAFTRMAPPARGHPQCAGTAAPAPPARGSA